MPYQPRNIAAEHSKHPRVRRFYRGRAWQEMRARVLHAEDYICQGCNRSDAKLDAHHEYCVLCYPEHALDTAHLSALCRSCHSSRRAKHRRQPLPQPRALTER
jgi:5-methylcytosine-specific restriction endonuclease McrA